MVGCCFGEGGGGEGLGGVKCGWEQVDAGVFSIASPVARYSKYPHFAPFSLFLHMPRCSFDAYPTAEELNLTSSTVSGPKALLRARSISMDQL